ncbi:MAG: phosphopantetheine adenylyltransferase, partial [uncultured bacterium]
MTKVTKKYLGAQAADSVSSTNERDELLDNPTSSSEGVDEYLGGVSHAAPVGSPVDSGGGTHLFATPITLPDGAVIFDPHWLPGQTGAFFPVSSSSSIGSHEINAMRDSLDLYDKLILVLDLPIFLPVDVRKARVNAVYQQLQSRLKATEMEKIHVVGSTMPFADLMDEWGMRTMLRSVPMNNLESVLADDKYQTMYVIPSSSLAYLPVDDFIEKRLEAVLVYLTGLLQKYFPQETEYQKTLARSRIDAMAAEKPLLQRLGESLPAADPMVAFYPGSFDPLTNGHLDILRQALGTFKKIYVGVATNPNKKYKYSSAIRKELILESLRNAGLTNVEVIDYPTSTPTAKMASSLGAGTLIRGVRDLADLKYELVLSWTTHVLDPRLRTVLLKSKDYASVSSSGTKVNFEARQDISRVVPGPVYWELMRDELAKWPHRPRLVGLVGGIGSGKSTVRQGFQNDGRVLTIDFDKVWHDLMADSVVAAELVAAFGTEILVEGQVDRVKLREVAFSGDERKRLTLSHIARIHVMRKAFEIIQDTAHEHPEISTILFEGYGLVNGGMYRVLDELWFVDTPEETRIERVLKDSHRGHQTREHVARVMASQRAILEAARAKADVVLDNSKGKPHLVDQITLARALSFFKTNWDEVKDYLGIEDEDGSIFEKMFPPKGAEMESKEFYVARDRMALFVALQEAESKADRELFQKALYARAGEESEKAAAVRRDRTEDLLSRLKADVPEWIRRAVGPLERIDPIALNAHAWAEQVAVVSGGQKITYGELDDHADRLALFIKTMNQTPVMGMYPIG